MDLRKSSFLNPMAETIGAALDKIPDSEKNPVDGHAGRTETEFVMASRPDLVHLERDNLIGAITLHGLDHLKHLNTPVDWYSNHPTHQDVSAVHSKREIVQLKCELAAQYVADCIKAIKADTKATELMDEYYSAWH